MDKLQSQREALVREQQQVQAAIRGELRPQVEALRDKLAIFTAALEKAKAKGNGVRFEPIERERERGVAHTIATRPGGRQTDNFIKEHCR